MGGQRVTKIERPTKVKVGFATYAIKWLTDEEWYAGKHNDNWGGVTEHEEMHILLRCTPERNEDSLRETLLHEVQHAIWCVIALNHYPTPDDMEVLEEYIIHSTSGTLLGVLNDNPEVLAYLLNMGQPA